MSNQIPTFESVVEILERRRSRWTPTKPLATSHSLPNGTPTFKGVPNLNGMRRWLEELGHSEADINGLNIIHVAGTKGKGSTCAFIESILRAHGRRVGFPKKTGLYTSPHLIRLPERIRINFDPIPDDLFAQYVWEVFNGLSLQGDSGGPGYFQLLTLVSFHSFLREGVDVAIVETHRGGEFDATNVIPCPVVTAITAIGFDHVGSLGPSIENIAWHKGGIFKQGARAFSVTQEPGVAKVLIDRATQKGLGLQFVETDPSLPLGQFPDVQRQNCSLAREVCDAFLSQMAPESPGKLSSQDILDGIAQFFWPGRFQVVPSSDCVWFLDGAHNELSIDKAAEWFATGSKLHSQTPTRVLIFAQHSLQRDGKMVLRRFAEVLQVSFDQIIFTLGKNSNGRNYGEGGPVLREYTQIWEEMVGGSSSCLWDTSAAMDLAKTIGSPPRHILVTGSLHLVGDVLEMLESDLSRK